MYVEDDMWCGIPLLHIYDHSMTKETPVVIFLHGFQSGKEHNLHYAYQLVKKGIRVIMPDALFHGQRAKSLSDMEMIQNFWKIVLTLIREVKSIYDEMSVKGYIGSNKIALAGTSMGAIVTSGCLKIYDWIDCAALCMGAPGYIDFANYQLDQMSSAGIKLPFDEKQIDELKNILATYDITLDPSRFKERPVLFWHGKKDQTVPFDKTYDFYEKLRLNYYEAPEKLKFIESPSDGHKVPRKGVLAVTDWLSHHLA